MVILKHENSNETLDDHNDCKTSLKDLVRAFERPGFERDVILNQPGELLKQVESFRRAEELWKKKTKDVLGKKNIETLKKAIDKKKTGTFKIDDETVSPDNSEFDKIKWKLDSMIGEKGVELIQLNDDPVKQRQVYLIKKTYLDEIKDINKELNKRLEHYKENAVKIWSVGLNEQRFDFDEILSRVGPSKKHHDKIYEVTIKDKHLSTPDQVY